MSIKILKILLLILLIVLFVWIAEDDLNFQVSMAQKVEKHWK